MITTLITATAWLAAIVAAYRVAMRWLDTRPTIKALAEEVERCKQAQTNLAKASSDEMTKLDQRMTQTLAKLEILKTPPTSFRRP